MNWNHRLAIWITDLLCPRLGKAAPPNHCPDFMTSSIWDHSRRKQRLQQFKGDFALGVFFAMVFAIVVHMVAGR